MKNALLILLLGFTLGTARAQEQAVAPTAPANVESQKPEAPPVEVPKVEAKAEPVAPVANAEAPKAEPAKPEAAPAVPEKTAPAQAAVPPKPPAVPLMPQPETDLAEQGIPGKPLPAAAATAPVMRERLDHLGNSPTAEAPIDAEIAVILHNNRFYPARIKLKEGQATRLFFTSLNQKPAALIVEELQVQRWIARESAAAPAPAPAGEISRELSLNKITEVSLQPKRGTYMFHDALSGAVGEIIVE